MCKYGTTICAIINFMLCTWNIMYETDSVNNRFPIMNKTDMTIFNRPNANIFHFVGE